MDHMAANHKIKPIAKDAYVAHVRALELCGW